MAKKPSEMSAIARRGLMLVLSSPSGAGKTTLSRRLLAEDGGVTLSVSVTTRKMRPGEVEGRDYQFIDRRRFDALIEQDALLEWAEVFDNYYGTPAKPVPPPDLIMSLVRSTIFMKPSESMVHTSPVQNQPSSVQRLLSSGML